MIRNVIISKLAANKLQKLFDYLTENRSLKVKEDFVEKLDRSIGIIKNQPESFPKSNVKPGLYKCVITKQTTVFYKFTSNKIIIVTIFDNRQNPAKLNKEY